MAKTVTISMAEYEYMQTVISHDGMIIAKLESEIARLKEENHNLRMHKHGMTRTRLHRIWCSMRQRCNSENHKDYKFYGARGISICNEWDEFKRFYDWSVSNGYSDELTLDRIDNDGNYCPENCRWTDMKTQSKNKRCTKLTFNGETHTIAEWSEIIGVSNSAIRERLAKGLPMHEVLAPKGGGA